MKALPKNSIDILTDENVDVPHNDADQSVSQLYNSNDAKVDNNTRVLPFERRSITYQFDYNNHNAFLVVGLDENNAPIELLLHLPFADKITSSLCDLCFGLISASLQSNVALEIIIDQLKKSPLELANTVSQFIETRFAKDPEATVDSLSRLVVVE